MFSNVFNIISFGTICHSKPINSVLYSRRCMKIQFKCFENKVSFGFKLHFHTVFFHISTLISLFEVKPDFDHKFLVEQFILLSIFALRNTFIMFSVSFFLFSALFFYNKKHNICMVFLKNGFTLMFLVVVPITIEIKLNGKLYTYFKIKCSVGLRWVLSQCTLVLVPRMNLWRQQIVWSENLDNKNIPKEINRHEWKKYELCRR